MTKKELANYFRYLDDLRKDGATNMFGARPYLMQVFDLDKKTGSKVLSLWMKTYDGEKTPEERVELALKEI